MDIIHARQRLHYEHSCKIVRSTLYDMAENFSMSIVIDTRISRFSIPPPPSVVSPFSLSFLFSSSLSLCLSLSLCVSLSPHFSFFCPFSLVGSLALFTSSNLCCLSPFVSFSLYFWAIRIAKAMQLLKYIALLHRCSRKQWKAGWEKQATTRCCVTVRQLKHMHSFHPYSRFNYTDTRVYGQFQLYHLIESAKLVANQWKSPIINLPAFCL